MDIRADLISVARGEQPCDLLLANGRIVNVLNGRVERGSVAIQGETIAAVGDYSRARQRIDLHGEYVAPGFIDGHAHLESSMLDVPQYAMAVASRGTTGIVTDLHEIANVSGIAGLRYVIDSARDLPLDIFLMAPSAVPATSLETSGACLDAKALVQVREWKQCIGLGEVMNYPGVLSGDREVLAKLALFEGRRVDGHAPGLTGNVLRAYIAAGIRSDHESVALCEAEEKLSLGMHIMIREGSSEKNLEALLPLVNDKTYPMCMLVVDDRSCVDILEDGDLDAVVRRAIRLGLDPVRAIQLATINPSRYFGLEGQGAIAPGYQANIAVIEDLSGLRVDRVFYHGKLVAEAGESAFQVKRPTSAGQRGIFKVKPFVLEDLRVPSSPSGANDVSLRVIEIVPGQIITRQVIEHIETKGLDVRSNLDRDILKLAVVERHTASGNIGLGFVRGFGLKSGAIASSVSHDSHNIIVAAVDDTSMYCAVKEIERMGGGLVACLGDHVLACLPLPIAGLLSDRPLDETVNAMLKLEATALELGCTLPSPFASLSFLALPVIPALRLTDLGLVDVGQFKLVSLQC